MIDIFSYMDLCAYLKDVYRSQKEKNPNFSHRYVGMKVGFSPGYFSRILSGEKLLSAAMVEKFSLFLKHSKREGEYFRLLALYSQAKEYDEKNRYYKQLLSFRQKRNLSKESKGYRLFTQEAHSVVYSLCRVEEIYEGNDYAALGKKLSPKLTAWEIKKSLELLLDMNLIVKDEDGRYNIQDSFLSSVGDSELHVQNYLMNSIHKAANALEVLPREERHVSSMMVTVSQDGYDKIQERIDSVRKEINQIIAEDTGVDRVCQANFHLFPLYKRQD